MSGFLLWENGGEYSAEVVKIIYQKLIVVIPLSLNVQKSLQTTPKIRRKERLYRFDSNFRISYLWSKAICRDG